MNAIPARTSLIPQANLLELRRAQMLARLADLEGTQIRSQHISLLIRPGATQEERVSLATLLLADLPFRIEPEAR